MLAFVLGTMLGCSIAVLLDMLDNTVKTPEDVAEKLGVPLLGVIPKQKIEEIVREVFDLRPAAIIEYLDLLRPIYRPTAAYGHFGRTEETFSWEQTPRVDEMRKLAGI